MNKTHSHELKNLEQQSIRRFQWIFAIGGISYPIWGIIIGQAIPGTAQSWALRWAIAASALIALGATLLFKMTTVMVERIFFVLALAITLHAQHLIDINNSHGAFILAFQLLMFTAASCFEKRKYTLAYLAFAVCGLFVFYTPHAAMPSGIVIASTLTFALVITILSFDRERLNSTIEQRDKHTKALIETVPGSISWIDRDLNYLEVNHSLAASYGLKPKDFVGKKLGFLMGSDVTDLQKLIEDTFQSPTPTLSREITVQQGAKSTVYLMTCSRYQNGKEAVLVGMDISGLKEKEKIINTQQLQLIQASKLSALGEMSAGVAHEINNPLAIIIGYSVHLKTLIKQDPIDRAQVEKFAARIEAMTGRIAKIIQGLRSFSREASNDPMVKQTLQTIVHETLELCGQRFANNGVELKLDGNLKNITVKCRSVQISQVLLNLLTNAFDAIQPLESKWIAIDAHMSGDQVNLWITDSGSGIAPEIVEKMLDPFFTTKPVGKGTGLGLSISKGIMEAQGGSLKYDETSAHTRFVLVLPNASYAVEETTEDSSSKAA